MATLNQCNFIGNVGKLETRYLSNGDAVVNLSIAINENWKDSDGKKHEKTEWVNIVFYKKLAEIASEYLKVGQSLFVSGKMQTRKWQAKDGTDRYSTEIIADEMQMLGAKSAQSNSGDTSSQASDNNSSKAQDSGFDDFESDIPF